MPSLIARLLIGCVMLVGIAPSCFASPVGDQFEMTAPTFAVDVDSQRPLGQSFTPRFPVNWAQFNLGDIDVNGVGATFRLQIREGGGFGGAVLGTSRNIYLPDGWGVNSSFGGWKASFPFNQEILTQPDALYTLELQKVSGDAFEIFGADPAPYARGAAYEDGVPRSGDYNFVVGHGYDTRPIADFDNDFDVDGADLLTWQRGLGTTGTAWRRDGDADGDLDVDAADLDVWRTDFGPFGHFAAPVPEPASLGVFASITALVIARPSARRR